MARRPAKKKNPPAPERKANATPEAPTVGGELFSDIQQRCESLKAWHDTASARLTAREAELAAFADALTELKTHVDTQQAQLVRDQQALQEDRTALESDAAAVAALRDEIDGEWASLRALRTANEQLARELEVERERQTQRAFKLTPTTRRKKAA